MKSIFIIASILLLYLGNSTSPACPVNHIWNTGCVKLCTHPDFRSCGDVFPALYNPSFCALERSGRWKSETYACAACKRPEVIGVKDGRCSCELEGCPSGQTCSNGQCKPSSPIVTPPIIVLPSPGNCAAITCQAGWKCVYGKCIPGPGLCGSNNDCDSFEFCYNGKCTDRCATIVCSGGAICNKGRCVSPPRECRYSYECPLGFTCTVNGRCVDKCQGVICNAASRCIDGECVALCENIRCDPGFYCYNGKCLPIDGYCSTGHQCKTT